MSLEIKNLTYSYTKDKTILKDINFTINSGEIVGLTAPSGYGKSTLGKIIASYIKSPNSQIFIDNKNIKDIKGFNPIQMIHQHPEKSINPRWKIKKILNEGFTVPNEILNKLEIDPSFLERYPNELSGGQLQRICIARALSKDTKYIIADEITTMLDAVSQVKLCKIILDIAKNNNIGILFISHNKILIQKISDRIIDLTKINNKKI